MRRTSLQGMGYPRMGALARRKFRGQQLDRTDFLVICLCNRDARSGLLRGNNNLQQYAPRVRGSGTKEARTRHVHCLRSKGPTYHRLD